MGAGTLPDFTPVISEFGSVWHSVQSLLNKTVIIMGGTSI
jgi:hypothetical protein